MIKFILENPLIFTAVGLVLLFVVGICVNWIRKKILSSSMLDEVKTVLLAMVDIIPESVENAWDVISIEVKKSLEDGIIDSKELENITNVAFLEVKSILGDVYFKGKNNMSGLDVLLKNKIRSYIKKKLQNILVKK